MGSASLHPTLAEDFGLVGFCYRATQPPLEMRQAIRDPNLLWQILALSQGMHSLVAPSPYNGLSPLPSMNYGG